MLLGLLLLYRGFDATPLKDKVYALANVGPDNLAVEFSYTAEDAAVYHELALKLPNKSHI